MLNKMELIYIQVCPDCMYVSKNVCMYAGVHECMYACNHVSL